MCLINNYFVFLLFMVLRTTNEHLSLFSERVKNIFVNCNNIHMCRRIYLGVDQ